MTTSDPARRAVSCRRAGCGHPYDVHGHDEGGGWCEAWAGPPAAGRVGRCRCAGFLWIDPAGPSPTYGP